MSEPIGTYFTNLITKLSTHSAMVGKSNNIVVGACNDLLKLFPNINSAGIEEEVINFPRIEILMDKLKWNGYASQREVDKAITYDVVGYIYRTSDEITLSDQVSIALFGQEIIALNYSFHDDKQKSKLPCPGFLKMGEFPELILDFELIPRISMCLFSASAEYQNKDTNY
jgi:hypothetical protein